MATPSVREIRSLVPAKNLELSLRFYERLGWSCSWREDGLAQLELAGVG